MGPVLCYCQQNKAEAVPKTVVHMGLGCKMKDKFAFFPPSARVVYYKITRTDVPFGKLVVSVSFNLLQVGQTGTVIQAIQVNDDIVVRIFLHQFTD